MISCSFRPRDGGTGTDSGSVRVRRGLETEAWCEPVRTHFSFQDT
jgi:hypothetical protein